MSSNKLLVLIGSGPGIGVATASLFASKGFSVALLSRNAQRLSDDAQKVRAAGGSSSSSSNVQTFTVDASDHTALRSTLEQVHQSMGRPEVVVYNAARVGPSTLGEFTPEEMLQDYKLNNVGIYVAATWALPLLAESAKSPGAHPSFLLSGSGIGYRPFVPFFSLSMQKAAQSNFLLSFEQVAGPQGVHVARVDINGVVSPDDPELSPDAVAAQHWRLYQQDKASWEKIANVSDMDTFARKMGVQ